MCEKNSPQVPIFTCCIWWAGPGISSGLHHQKELFVPPPPPGLRLSSAAVVKRFTLGGARRTDSRRLSSSSVRTWQGNTNRGLQTASLVKPSKVSLFFLTETVFDCFSHILIHVVAVRTFESINTDYFFENFHWGFWTYFSLQSVVKLDTFIQLSGGDRLLCSLCKRKEKVY